MAGGGRDAGLAGSLDEVTSLAVTQPRVAISFKLNNKLKEEDGKEHNEGRKNQVNPKPNSKFHDILPAPGCFQTACCVWTQFTIFCIARSRRHQVENYKYYYNYASFPLP